MNRAFIAERPLSFLLGQQTCLLFIQSRFGFFRWFSTRLTGNSEYCPSTAERWCCPEHRNCTPVWSSWAEGERRLIHWSTAINIWKQTHIGQQYNVLKWSTATACVSKNRAFMLYVMKLLELAKKQKMWCGLVLFKKSWKYFSSYWV